MLNEHCSGNLSGSECEHFRLHGISCWLAFEITSMFGAPTLGSAERGHPDLFRFVPFSSDLFRFALLVFGNTPICSDLFRFAPICSICFQNKSEYIRETPFCRPLLQVPDMCNLSHINLAACRRVLPGP